MPALSCYDENWVASWSFPVAHATHLYSAGLWVFRHMTHPIKAQTLTSKSRDVSWSLCDLDQIHPPLGSHIQQPLVPIYDKHLFYETWSGMILLATLCAAMLTGSGSGAVDMWNFFISMMDFMLISEV